MVHTRVASAAALWGVHRPCPVSSLHRSLGHPVYIAFRSLVLVPVLVLVLSSGDLRFPHERT